jgi:hypothetical protein
MAQDTGIKTFVSSAIVTSQDEDAANERTTVIDDISVTFTLPDINQVILANSMIEGAASNIEAGAALINIFFGLIKPDEIESDPDDPEDDGEPVFVDFTARKLQTKMMNPKDPFGIEVIADVMTWLLEEWSARPTTPSSPSSNSPRRRGSTSKATPRGGASTRGGTGR